MLADDVCVLYVLDRKQTICEHMLSLFVSATSANGNASRCLSFSLRIRNVDHLYGLFNAIFVEFITPYHNLWILE